MGSDMNARVRIVWMVIRWIMEYEWDKGNNKESLKYDKSDGDNRGELAKLLLHVFEFVMYEIYVQWKRGRSRTINNKIGREMIRDTMQDDLE